MRVAFLTLLLGLTLSEQKIDIATNGDVARVEVLLDDRVVSTLTQAPWSATVDFGEVLAPHRLVARALDSKGAEVGRAEQSINVPRRAAETQLLLERDEKGKPRNVRVVWDSLEGQKPKEVQVWLDGARISVGSDLRAQLPSNIDLSKPHLVRALLASQLGVRSDAEMVIGGEMEDAASAELTAVMLHSDELSRALTVRGAPAAVVATETGSSEIFIVRHPLEAETGARLDAGGQAARRRSMGSGASNPMIGMGLGTGAGTLTPLRGVSSSQFIWPVSSRTGKADLFPPSREYIFRGAEELKRILCDVGFPGAPPALRFADAAAVAGLRASASKRPRAVVVIIGERQTDASRLDPSQVRAYLRALRVPLYVWTLGANDGGWGDTRDISSPHGYTAAYEEVKRDLDSQRIVWLRGAFLPQEIQ